MAQFEPREDAAAGHVSALVAAGMWALAGYLILVPLLAPAFASAHNMARAAQAGLLLLCAVGLLVGATLPAGPWPARYGLVCLALALAACAGAERLLPALRELALDVGLLGLALFVRRAVHVHGARWLVVAAVVAWALYGALFVIVACLAFVTERVPNGWMLVVGFDSPRFANHVQTVAIPLLAAATSAREAAPRLRLAAWWALVLSFVVLTLSFGRASMLALLLAGGLAAVLFGAEGRRQVLHLLLAACVGALIYGLVFVYLPDLTQGETASGPLRDSMSMTADHSRFALWRLAASYVEAHPWLGIGPMHFAHHVNPIGAHPHNIYLQLASEAGVPLTLMLVLGALVGLLRAARCIRAGQTGGDRSFSIGLFLACVAAAVDGAFSGNFVMPLSQVWIAGAAGALAGLCVTPGAWADTPRPRARWPVLLLTAVQLWLAAATWVEARHEVPRLGEPVKTNAAQGVWWPRYWLDGWF